MQYFISENLQAALNRLFDDPTVVTCLLGVGVPDNMRDSPDKNATPLQRIASLQVQLEEYISQLSEEAEELGPDEIPRLRAEATAFLIVLRELKEFFPEVFP